MKGRVASLLEVGTGMHPEMTARQNIYLNGSLMGMRRHEITSKLEEIVDFAGIEKYIDTPTKRFSSGMTVRLGFAIAAFLEPEVLIVDEVLAVGDAEFQKKAIGKMKEVTSGGGRTVLFVSHDMAAITKLCENVIVMNHGNIIHQNKTEESIQFYRNQISTDVSNFDLSKRDDKKSMAYFTDFSIVNSEKISNNSLLIDESALFQFKINSKEKVNVSVRIAIFDHNEMRILAFDSRDTSLYFDLSIGENSIKCEIKRGLEIKPGKYYVNISMRSKNELLDHIVKIKVLDIEPTDYFGSGKLITSDIPLVLKKNEWSFN
jgi:lipopolysaccharide transport system ATP-binding protein